MKKTTFAILLTFLGSYLSAASVESAYCYQYNDLVAGENIDKPMRIASLSKLFSSYFLLKQRGADFKYKTLFWVDSHNDLYIQGSSDPYFLEHGIFSIIKTLNDDEVKSVRNIYFDSNFIFHFSKNPNKIKAKLKSYFNTAGWRQSRVIGNSLSIIKQYKQVRELVLSNMKQLWPEKLRFSFKKVSLKKQMKIPKQFWTISSVKLIDYVKILNSYSNNTTTDELVEQLGGAKALENFIKKELSLDVKLFTASGLNYGSGANRRDNLASCRDVLKLSRALTDLVRKHHFNVNDLMPTAVADVGTMSQRFFDWEYARNFVYKSGTLKQKPTSALVAMHREKELKIVSLAQGGKRYISLKNREKDVLDQVVNKISLKYKKIPYESKDFFMISSIDKTRLK